MSRQLGAFDDDDNFDRPDLNKCPDCGCYFSQNNCPFCGKACPEDMRAGMRKPVKVRKKRSSGNGRVTFVEWYHSWWFILIMTFVFPLAAVFLLISSPYAKKWKILFTSGDVSANHASDAPVPSMDHNRIRHKLRVKAILLYVLFFFISLLPSFCVNFLLLPAFCGGRSPAVRRQSLLRRHTTDRASSGHRSPVPRDR